MLETLHIQNYKSIRDLQIPCKRINVFVGEPNAGKTNVIEALALHSLTTNNRVQDFVRFKDLTDLFYDNLTTSSIRISTNLFELSVELDPGTLTFQFHINNNDFMGQGSYDINYNSNGTFASSGGRGLNESIRQFKYYKYENNAVLNKLAPGALSSPFGENLVHLIISNQKLKELVSDLIREKGFRLNIRPVERELLISKEKNSEIYSYSYNNISETLKRIVFFMACIETNRDAIILFDEPETNTFPFYTKYMAERIALDGSNQYFFTTHNPYLLRSVIEKSPVDEIQVVVTHMENYETNARVLTRSELAEILETDIFFNLDLFSKQHDQS